MKKVIDPEILLPHPETICVEAGTDHMNLLFTQNKEMEKPPKFSIFLSDILDFCFLQSGVLNVERSQTLSNLVFRSMTIRIDQLHLSWIL